MSENKEKHPGGRPPMYATVEEMQRKIDEYFDSCGPELLKTKDGEIVPNEKTGKPYIIGEKIPTVTGLALALGFNSRQALLNYQAKEEFNDAITRAKSKVEEYVEARLFDRDGAQGAKFSLKNNFKGWSETGEANVGSDNSGIQAFLVATKPTAEALKAMFAEESEEEEDDGEETES